MPDDDRPDDSEEPTRHEDDTDQPGDDTPGAADLPLFRPNDVFYLLSQHRKRAVLLAIALSPWSRIHLRQLATLLCALEERQQVPELDTQQITTVRTNLKRSHLPPLVDAGVVAYESADSEVIVPGPGFGVALATLFAGGYSLGTGGRNFSK